MSDDLGNTPNPYQAPATEGEAPMMSSGAPLAGRVTRLAAVIVDGLINLLVTMPILFVTGYFARAMEQQVSFLETTGITILGMVIFVAIHGYLLANRGQTVGKMLLNVRIVDYQTGELLTLGKVVGLRYVPLWLISMIPIVGGLFALADALLIFGQERRCIHDLIAGTKVVVA